MAGAVIAAITAWMKIRRGWLSMSIRKTDRLYRLVSTKKWRTVDGAALQLAAEHAFGIDLDDREIRCALERHDPIGLLRGRVRAAHDIRWDPETREYRDDRMIKAIPLIFWRRLHEGLLALSAVFLVAFPLWAAQESWILAGIALAEGILLVRLSASACREVRAVEKLLVLHQYYPVVAQSEVPGLPKAGRRRTRREAAESA